LQFLCKKQSTITFIQSDLLPLQNNAKKHVKQRLRAHDRQLCF
jgi:hypothetical protein